MVQLRQNELFAHEEQFDMSWLQERHLCSGVKYFPYKQEAQLVLEKRQILQPKPHKSIEWS